MLFADLPSQVQRPFDRVFGENLCFRVDLLRPEIAVYGWEVREGIFGDLEGFVWFLEAHQKTKRKGLQAVDRLFVLQV